MGAPFSILGFPFTKGGLSSQFDASLIEAVDAVTAADCYLEDGVIRSLNDAGAALAGAGIPFAGGQNWIRWVPGANKWTSAATYETAIDDPANSRIFRTNAGGAPVIDLGNGTTQPMGIAQPTTAGVSATITGQGVTYGFSNTTWQNQFISLAIVPTTADFQTIRGNPVYINNLQFPNGGSVSYYIALTMPAAWFTDPKVGGVKIYATQASASAYLGTSGVSTTPIPATYYALTDGASTKPEEWTVSGAGTINIGNKWTGGGFTATVDTSNPLYWGPGGNTLPANTTGWTEDHSAPPSLDGFSSAVHATGASQASGGVIFAWKGNKAWWSKYGYAQYWPTQNFFAVPDASIETILTRGTQTLIITPISVYSATGLTDESIVVKNTGAAIGARLGTGRGWVMTPWGAIGPTRMGLGWFDGAQMRFVSQGKLSVSWLNGLTVNWGAFWDNRYYLFHTTGTLVMDMRFFPEVSFTTYSLVVNAVQRLSVATYAEALYVLKSGDTAPKPWNGGAALPWTWQTGDHVAGDPTRVKKFTTLYLDCAGNITVTPYRDGTALTAVNVTGTRGKPQQIRLPATFMGYRGALKFAGAAGAELHAYRLEGELVAS